MKAFLDRVTQIIYLICTAMFLGMTLVLFIQAILRYLTGYSIIWAEEISLLCMVWIVFLGAIIATIKLSHSRITFFVNKFPPHIRQWIVGLTSILSAFINLVIAYYGIAVVQVSTLSVSTALGFPMWILYISAPLSCFIMGVIFLGQGVLQVQGKYPLEVAYGEED